MNNIEKKKISNAEERVRKAIFNYFRVCRVISDAHPDGTNGVIKFCLQVLRGLEARKVLPKI